MIYMESESRRALQKLEEWLASNMLVLNYNKTMQIPFRTAREAVLDTRDGNIGSANEAKVLGVVLDSELSWRPHLDQLKSKLNSAVFVLRTVKKLLDAGTLRSVYFAVFHSLLSYGVIFWGNSTHAIHIFRIQKWAVRVMVVEQVQLGVSQL
ncbi:uncharacterized protein LOC120350218 [Nilaparvata lugens]|uniref:uncharacterized protein LOC120350218 n=1 Tax=Nilaparvata lugens TaxID=108931 RepID=UPI00193E0056|nr:uncharacterized protein LOC120350218 [Nilaparvata lugens]